MADQKISELTNITGANLANADEFVVVDVSADQTKAVTRAEFFKDTPPITVTGNIAATGNVSGVNGTFTGDVTIGDDLFITGPNPSILLTDNDVASEWSQIANISGNTFYNVRNGTANGHHIFQQNAGGTTTEAMRIDASRNVGIGTNSPTEKLHVVGNAIVSGDVTIGDDLFLTGPTPVITLTDNDVANEYTKLYSNGGSTVLGSRNGTANGSIIFRGEGGGVADEYARFNAAGDLGVGKTNPSGKLDVVGNALISGNIVSGEGSGAVALTTNDSQGNANVTFNHANGVPDFLGNGARIVVNTDSTSSPSMVFELGSAVTAGVSYSTTEYMKVNTNGISVTGTVTATGGIYLGGTAAVNLLDDYEEGTWTPVFSDATSGGNTATANGGKRGLYTKIGNQVTVSCASTNLDTTGMTGANDLYIQGLPFTPTSYVSPNHYWTGGTRLGVVSFNTNGFVTAYVSDAVTYVRLGETISGSSIDNIICSQLTSGSADIAFTMTYQTDA